MHTTSCSSRRDFLQNAVAVGAALVATAPMKALVGATLPVAARPIRLGADFDPPADPEELAMAHRKLGMRAAYCPAGDLKIHIGSPTSAEPLPNTTS